MINPAKKEFMNWFALHNFFEYTTINLIFLTSQRPALFSVSSTSLCLSTASQSDAVWHPYSSLILWLDTSILVSTLTNCCCSSPRCPSRSVPCSSTGLINRSVFFHSPSTAPLSGTILLIFLLLPLPSSSLPPHFHLCPPLSPQKTWKLPCCFNYLPMYVFWDGLLSTSNITTFSIFISF